MTVPKSALRQRRRNSVENLPKDIVEWFEGKRDAAATNRREVPLIALTPPYSVFLHKIWLAWKQEHPAGARPPAGCEYLDDPTDSRNRQGTHDRDRALEMLRAKGVDAEWMR